MSIGVFDSGLGGLTVFRALAERFPDQALTYFGDNANAPYGVRSPREILDLTLAGVQRLFDLDCRLVILACNTASAVALRPMQEFFIPADRRVLGVFVPVIEAVAGRDWADRAPPRPARLSRVLVFGTPATVASGAFPREVALRASGVEIAQVACPGLVDALEAGDRDRVAALVAGFVAQGRAVMPAPQAVVLGCTHYPLAEADFARHLPPGSEILSQAGLVADSLDDYLRRAPHFKAAGPVRLHTSGAPAAVAAQARALLGLELEFDPV